MAQYDFTLTPNGSQTLDVAGSYFTYKGGIGPIRVTPSSGDTVDLLPGQGMSGLKFDRLTIKDLSGAGNVGAVLAGNGAWRDERITGTVDVVDGAKSRTLAGQAFAGAFGSGSSAGAYARICLWNPPGSGKNVILESIALSASVAVPVNLYRSDTSATGVSAKGQSKLINTGVPLESLAQGIQDANQASPGVGVALYQLSVNANGKDVWLPKEPIVIAPGRGLMTWANTAASGFALSMEWFEETI